MPKTVSIVIRCYNEERHIGKLLYGIGLQQTDREVETIVVDSGSTDRTVAIAKRFPVRLLTIRPEEFSFGRALNIGCAEARGEFLVFVSAHVFPVYDSWLELMLEPFANSQVGVVYGKQRGGAETRYSEHQVFAQWFQDRDIPFQDTPFCNNANCAIRRALWERIPYDETLTGLEDLAWARQIGEIGYRVSYVADAEVIHLHEERARQIMNRYMREAIALKHIYPEQHMSIVDFVRLLVQNTTSDYRHAIRDGQVMKNILDIPLFRLMQFWGAYRGFQQEGPIHEKLKRTFYYPRRPVDSSGEAYNNQSSGRIDYNRYSDVKRRVD